MAIFLPGRIGACAGALAACLVAPPANAASESVLYAFNVKSGFFPAAPLIKVGEKLFGTNLAGNSSGACSESGCGAVFSVTLSGTHKVVHAFMGGSDGSDPTGGLVEAGGVLYGTTPSGGGTGCGGFGCGTVYSLTPEGAYAVLYAFHGGTDGAAPSAPPIDIGGTLYGTTASGGGTGCGGNGCGTVFTITPSGTETVLYAFQGGSDGASPNDVINFGDTLYGTSYAGGGSANCLSSGCGTVFSVTTAGTETVLYSFLDGTTGLEPKGRLLKVKNALYGTTGFGGHGCKVSAHGTVFSMSLAGSHKLKVLHSFCDNTTGVTPNGGLVDVSGTLYGTTMRGGVGGTCDGGACGTVFSIVPNGAFAVVYSFQDGSDGFQPEAGLLDLGGTLYGTTYWGGDHASQCSFNGCGTVFAVTP